MSVNIQFNEENNFYTVNGKTVHQDQNGNWLSAVEALSHEEAGAFLEHIQAPIEKLIKRYNPNIVMEEVKSEMIFQLTKFGEQNHTPMEWLMILGEEVGEANKAALETHFNYKGTDADYSEYRAELIQVAAVAISMIQSLDRNMHMPKYNINALPELVDAVNDSLELSGELINPRIDKYCAKWREALKKATT